MYRETNKYIERLHKPWILPPKVSFFTLSTVLRADLFVEGTAVRPGNNHRIGGTQNAANTHLTIAHHQVTTRLSQSREKIGKGVTNHSRRKSWKGVSQHDHQSLVQQWSP